MILLARSAARTEVGSAAVSALEEYQNKKDEAKEKRKVKRAEKAKEKEDAKAEAVAKEAGDDQSRGVCGKNGE